ncbi:MAG: hypothetical protein M3151_13760 [Actinomycetota bacterium]|nr:hypothetical protein [Actinomycetota bacterium]
MVRVSVEVREENDLFEVAVYGDTISQAVVKARDRFPGHAVRVVFPIDGEEFFGGPGTEENGTEDGGQPRLLPDRVL